MPENLHQQPCGITAGPHSMFKSFLAALDARIEPCCVANFVTHLSIQIDQKANRALSLARKSVKEDLEQWPGCLGRAIGFQIPGKLRRVFEGILFDSRFEKETEGIEGR